MIMVCQCGHDHYWKEKVCKNITCMCPEYKEAIEDNSVIPRHQKYLEQLEQTQDKVKYILENIPESRNLANKDFVFLYWHLVSKLDVINNQVIKALTDPESIRRCRQLLAQHNFEKYGPTDKELQDEKNLKENATYQYVLEKYQ